jgi:hypothetical protein
MMEKRLLDRRVGALYGLSEAISGRKLADLKVGVTFVVLL